MSADLDLRTAHKADVRTQSVAQRAVPARDVRIVAAASGRGAADPGCAGGPEALRRSDLLTRLWRGGLDPIWDATIPAPDTADASTAVRSLCQSLSQRVRMLASRGAFPLVLGGDHSCAIGTWSGVASARRRTRASGPDLDRRAHGCARSGHLAERRVPRDAACMPAGRRRPGPGGGRAAGCVLSAAQRLPGRRAQLRVRRGRAAVQAGRARHHDGRDRQARPRRRHARGARDRNRRHCGFRHHDRHRRDRSGRGARRRHARLRAA